MSSTHEERLYAVTLHRTEYHYAVIEVLGDSEQAAGELAREIVAEEDLWQLADAEEFVANVESLEGGEHV